MMLFPAPLTPGDEIRILALSRSLGGVTQPGGFTEQDIEFTTRRLESLGLRVIFGPHVRECNAHLPVGGHCTLQADARRAAIHFTRH